MRHLGVVRVMRLCELFCWPPLLNHTAWSVAHLGFGGGSTCDASNAPSSAAISLGIWMAYWGPCRGAASNFLAPPRLLCKPLYRPLEPLAASAKAVAEPALRTFGRLAGPSLPSTKRTRALHCGASLAPA